MMMQRQKNYFALFATGACHSVVGKGIRVNSLLIASKIFFKICPSHFRPFVLPMKTHQVPIKKGTIC